MSGYELLHFIITGGRGGEGKGGGEGGESEYLGGGGGMNDNHVSLPNVAAAGCAWKANSIL